MPTKAARPPTTEKTDPELLRVATFIIFDALIFHQSLSAANARVAPLSRLRAPYRRALLSEWENILRIDYREVFQIAREILSDFPAAPETEEILKEIIIAADDIVSSGILRKHDFLGRIYHKLLLRTTGHFYATYYTSIPAAWLLAQLAIRTEHPEWRFESIDRLADFRILDPACGSGTLLSASYMALRDNLILAGPKALDTRAFHRWAIEKVIHGWDVLDFAAHLSLTTLALHHHAEFGQSNFHVMIAGIDEHGEVRLGSLDHLSSQIALVGRSLDFGDVALRTGLEVREQARLDCIKVDLVIMNPPFSRSANPNVKFGYSDATARKRMVAALKNITRDLGLEGIGHAGLGAYFVVLADKLLKAGGRMAFVLPRALLSGVSWGKIRELLRDNYAIEYVVSNYDPGEKESGIEPWNWSENTDLAEVLVVARKLRDSNEIKSPQGAVDNLVTYVGLWNKPRNEVESLLISQQVQQKRKRMAEEDADLLRIAGKNIGHVLRIGQDKLRLNWLYPSIFANPTLNLLLIRLLNGSLHAVRMRDLASSTGTDIKQIKDAFKHASSATPHRLLWGQQASMATLFLAKDAIGFGLAQQGTKSELLHRSRKSSVLISERPHLSNDCVIAVETEIPVLATAFWEIQLNDEKIKPVVLTWLNSTPGLLCYLGISTNSMGEIFKTKKDQLDHLLIPNPDTLDLDEWRHFYGRIKSQPLLQFPAEFELAASGNGLRMQIDDFVLKSLGLRMDIASYYALLAKEPVFSLQRL
ncbi:MAG: hypothetical protein HY748_11800 [Elusimicrobia bacterium]|nr:hypothetical protein [Elusimicrobiota bacterium]